MVLTVLLLLGALPLGVGATVEDDFGYEIENGGAVITAYYGSHEDPYHLTIPGTLGGYPVTAIDGWVFQYVSNLERITVPGSVREIRSCAFYGCPDLKKVVAESGLQTVGDEAFAYCGKLQSVTLPDTVTELGRSDIPRKMTENNREVLRYTALKDKICDYI